MFISKNKNTYIHQLKAEKYLQLIGKRDNENISFDDLKLNFRGSLPDSLTMRYIQKKYPDKFSVFEKPFLNINGKIETIKFVRTTAIIDVTFDNDYRELLDVPVDAYKDGKLITYNNSYGDIITKKKIVRNEIYNEGFTIEGVKYSLFTRSSSKSRLSQCLFIEDDILDDIQLWGRMGLEFVEDEECDLASLMAYESLTLSGIIGKLNILPHEILLIEDCKSYFTSMASVTEYNDKLNKLEVSERKESQESDIFDGQSLLDKSKFVGIYKNKGCLLLRNKFFKSCAFNTNIQLFFKKNKITEISQLKGITLATKISDIKYIITPNSLKALKFAYKLNVEEDKAKEAMFKYWLKHIDHNYGVCKFEKSSPFGEHNQTSYQMLNSLFLDYDKILELAGISIEQINSINNSFDSFKKHICVGDSINLSREMLYNICCVNSDVQHIEMYKENRRDAVKSLKKKMRRGKLLIDGDYAIIVSNPIEMLKNACGIKWSSSIHKPYEVYTTMFNHGDELVGFRNPHVCAGNVCVLKNKYNKKINKYMNLTKNICVISSYQNDILARWQGADMDSDQCLIVKNGTCLAAAKDCQKFYTPLNKIQLDKQKRKYNKNEMADIDYCIGENFIGKIINLSQLFNSYYWDYKYKGTTAEQLQVIYDCVSMCSSLSQLEIDKAKKFFTLGVKAQLTKISDAVFNQNKLDVLTKGKKAYTQRKSKLKRLIDIDVDTMNKENYQNVCDSIAEIEDGIRKINYDESKFSNMKAKMKRLLVKKSKLEINLDEKKLSEYESVCREINRITYCLDENKEAENSFKELKKKKSSLLSSKKRLEPKLKINMNEKNQSDYIAVCNSEMKVRQDISEFIEENKIIRLSEVQIKKVLLSDEESETIRGYDEALENKDITEEEYNRLVSKVLTKAEPKIKQTKPLFFKNNSKDKNCNFDDFYTPMDFLTAIVDDNKKIPKAPVDKNCMEIEDLLIDNRVGVQPDRKHIISIVKIANDTRKRLNMCYLNNSKEDKFDYEKYKHGKEIILCEAIGQMKKVKISKPETILLLLRRCYSNNKKVKNDKESSNRRTIISLLYKAHTEMFINCFRKEDK